MRCKQRIDYFWVFCEKANRTHINPRQAKWREATPRLRATIYYALSANLVFHTGIITQHEKFKTIDLSILHASNIELSNTVIF